MHYIKMPVRAALKSSCALALAAFLTAPAYSQTFSYVPGAEVELLPQVETDFRLPYDINEAGDVVGVADYNWALRAVLWPGDGSPPVRLDTSNEFDETNSSANAINDNGDIVGNFKGATLWVNGQPSSPSNGGSFSDINNNGLIVGSSNIDSSGPHAAVWDNFNRTYLGGEPNGANSTATSVNSVGDVAGAVYTTENYKNFYAPVVWRSGQIDGLGKLPSLTETALANDLNDIGQVVGYSNASVPSSSTRAVIWQNGKIATLGTLGGEYSIARKINNASQIVGNSTILPGETMSASANSHPILWQNGVLYDLAPTVNMVCGGASGRCLGYAHSINEAGQIIISAYDDNGRNSYRLTFTDQALALSQLPSVAAPLNFVTPEGGGNENPFFVDLALTMQASPDPVQVDEQLTYDITVTNNGGIPGHNVRVDIPIANDVTYVSSTNSAHILVCTNYISSGRGKDKTPRTTRVLCNFGTLNVGVTENIQLVVQPNSGGTVSQTITATSDEGDDNNSDNSVTVTTTVEGGDTGGGGKPCKGKKCN